MTTLIILLCICCLLCLCTWNSVVSKEVKDLRQLKPLVHKRNIFRGTNLPVASSVQLVVECPANELKEKDMKSLARNDQLPFDNIYVFLTCLFVTCLVTSNILDAKLFSFKLPFSVFTIDNTAGMVTFPFTFIIGDIINEFYGSQATKFTVFTGLAMSILVAVVISIGQSLPYLNRPYNVSKESFDMIFGCAKSIFAASTVSFLITSLLDIWLFKLIKRLTQGKYLWLRAYGSTAISQLVDTTLMAYLAFSLGKNLSGQPSASLQEVWQLSITGYCLKLILAGLLTPLLYITRNIVSRSCSEGPPDRKW